MFLTNSRCKDRLFDDIGDWYHYMIQIFLPELLSFLDKRLHSLMFSFLLFATTLTK